MSKEAQLPQIESAGLSVQCTEEGLAFRYDLDAAPPQFPINSYVTYNVEGKKISDSILKIIKQPRRVTGVLAPRLIMNTRRRRRGHNQFSYSATLDPVNRRQGVITHKINPKIKDDQIVNAYIEYRYETENESTGLAEAHNGREMIQTAPPWRGASKVAPPGFILAVIFI